LGQTTLRGGRDVTSCLPYHSSYGRRGGGKRRWTFQPFHGKFYVGSSVDLGSRFTTYYSFLYISVRSKSTLICRALLKYGYSKFKIEILEYCEKEILLLREQYYLDLLKPSFPTPPPPHTCVGWGLGVVKLPRGTCRSPLRSKKICPPLPTPPNPPPPPPPPPWGWEGGGGSRGKGRLGGEINSSQEGGGEEINSSQEGGRRR